MPIARPAAATATSDIEEIFVTACIGDVPVASTLSTANMMYDMQSVSVLKGPQGPLFGANSTGGEVIFQPYMTRTLGLSVRHNF